MKARVRGPGVTIYVIFCAFLCVSLWVCILPAIQRGYLPRWHWLPSPPAKIEELVWASYHTVYARTSTSAVYRFVYGENQGWIEAELPKDDSRYPEEMSTKPCNHSTHEFSWFMFPPDDVVDCVQGSYAHIDCV